MELIFKTKDGKESRLKDGEKSDCKAVQVLAQVLAGVTKLPDGLELRYAPSYNAHYVRKRGKNACGFFDTKDLLVINGIATELEEAGIAEIVKPAKNKNYKAIRLTEMDAKSMKTLVSTIRRVLGITSGKASKAKGAKAKKKTKVTVAESPA